MPGHLMLMSRETDVSNAGTTGSKVSVTLTIPVVDVCYAFATDLCYTHTKCSSCLSWMIVMLDIDVFMICAACHVVLWCNLCIITMFKVGHSATHCGLSATINLNWCSTPKGMKGYVADIKPFHAQTH